MYVRNVSKQTKNNWLLDAGLFISAVLAALSGIYFLYLPVAGFQGGRNPMYGMTILFTREGWDALHTWSGVIMIAVALGHLVYHWKWVNSMLRRTWREMTGKTGALNSRSRMNLLLNLVVASTFIISAISGTYFLFVGGSHGGRVLDPMILFSRTIWDLIHTWSSVVFILAAIIHFVIHWRWVVNVSRRVAGSLFPYGKTNPSFISIENKN